MRRTKEDKKQNVVLILVPRHESGYQRVIRWPLSSLLQSISLRHLPPSTHKRHVSLLSHTLCLSLSLRLSLSSLIFFLMYWGVFDHYDHRKSLKTLLILVLRPTWSSQTMAWSGVMGPSIARITLLNKCHVAPQHKAD